MPLSCECYPGCWADHSKGWPRVSRGYDVTARAMLPYGTYVTMPDHLRIETRELVEKVKAEYAGSHAQAVPTLAYDDQIVAVDRQTATYDRQTTENPTKTPPELPAGLYRHYKGGVYLLLGIAQHSGRGGELLAVFVSLDASRPGPRLRACPLHGPAGWTTAVAGGQERFTYIGLDPRAGRTCRICKKPLELVELGQVYGTGEVTSIICDACANERMVPDHG